MKVLVCGGRHYDNEAAVYAALEKLQPSMRLLIHGACPIGADEFADAWAMDYDVPCLRHPARWAEGPSAGPRRNRAMLLWKPDVCVWFPGGSGTEGMKRLAEQAGVYLIDGEALANGQV